ncbi:MAG TPA: GGDEF domain-containing protein [Methylomirabilota bacterium]|nr:GGDEF domain-containing protein [Methylomirabilota bacterium]
MPERESQPDEEWVSELKAEQLMQEREQQEIQDKIMKDEATGLFNLKGLMEFGSRLIAERSREHLPVSVVVLDLDNLKKLNERFGHPKVNELLKAFGNHLTKIVREYDVVSRYGGDEFVVVFNAPKEKAGKLLAQPVSVEINGEKIELSFTAGAVDVDFDHGPDMKLDAKKKLQDAIETADQILMKSKKENKGTVQMIN